MRNPIAAADNDVASIPVSTEGEHHDTGIDIVTIVAEMDNEQIIQSGVSVQLPSANTKHSEPPAYPIQNIADAGAVFAANTEALIPDADSGAAGSDTALFVYPGDEGHGEADTRADDSRTNALLAKLAAFVQPEPSSPATQMSLFIDDLGVSLPDEPDGRAIRSVRSQLAELPGVERTKVLSNLYGPSLVSPPPETTFKIALHTEKNTAYIIHFSEANGWEDIEPVPPSDIWEQHTLTTVGTDS